MDGIDKQLKHLTEALLAKISLLIFSCQYFTRNAGV
jgi:hypothetical protein